MDELLDQLIESEKQRILGLQAAAIAMTENIEVSKYSFNVGQTQQSVNRRDLKQIDAAINAALSRLALYEARAGKVVRTVYAS